MKLLTWNCNLNLAQKFQILEPYNCDIFIIQECERLNKVMDTYDCVNVFLSEGAGLETIVNETEKEGGKILRDAFGHVRLDDLNPGQWFGKYLAKKLKADYTKKIQIPKETDLVIIGVPDDQIQQVSKKIKSKAVIHTSGTKKLVY